MTILRFPDPRLFSVCSPVTVYGPELKLLLDSMWSTMIAAGGIGLAANQVGLSFKMFTMEGIDEEKLYIVNPRVLSKSAVPANLTEGCLSAPGEFLIRSDRSSWIQIEYQNELGIYGTRTFKGILSVCVEHEMEHLQGKGFMESTYLPKAKRIELSKKWGIK